VPLRLLRKHIFTCEMQHIGWVSVLICATQTVDQTDIWSLVKQAI